MRETGKHNAAVMAHFANRPKDLLIMDMSAGHGWKELCAFLGDPVPEGEYPKTGITVEVCEPAPYSQ